MSKMTLVVGILSVVMAVIVFVLVDDLRRYYSGLFFTIIGAVMLLNVRCWKCNADK